MGGAALTVGMWIGEAVPTMRMGGKIGREMGGMGTRSPNTTVPPPPNTHPITMVPVISPGNNKLPTPSFPCYTDVYGRKMFKIISTFWAKISRKVVRDQDFGPACYGGKILIDRIFDIRCKLFPRATR